MKAVSRLVVLALFVARAAMADAQSGISVRPARLTVIDARSLEDARASGPGRGEVVPGLDLRQHAKPWYAAGDEPAFADRSFNDSTWTPLNAGGAADTSRVRWVRFHVLPDKRLNGVPVLLNVVSDAAMQVFLNGRPVLHLDEAQAGARKAEARRTVTVPVTFTCDGKPEVLAVRYDQVRTRSDLRMILQAGNNAAVVERNILHFGLFIGVNLIIFLLALAIYTLDRQDRSWLLLALLSLVTAATAFCDVGDDVGLGISGAVVRILAMGQVVLLAWPMALLILVLRQLRGNTGRPPAWVYTVMASVMTLLGAGFAGIGLYNDGNGTELIKLDLNGSPGIVVATLVMVLLYGLITLGLAIEVVRHSVRVVRASGYGRWIGAGALVSMLLSLILQMSSAFAGSPDSSWPSVAGQYCSYVALPLSVVIYLAIRAARNNKLVARQRDDLDLEVQERTAELREAKDRSDELLLNILPEEVADELKLTGAAAAKHFERVTILFTDFKDFTAASERLSPQELVEELNTCFKAFDHIVSARGIEKIKTIGDAYMCAGGLPDPRSSTPVDVVHAALEMQDFMKRRKTERQALGRPAFDMRVGIHTGPVVAGIVGVKKFQYDIWGDTVNTASRLESSGEVGQVNISEHTYHLVKEAVGLRFTPRGKVNAKGKGELEMFYVEQG